MAGRLTDIRSGARAQEHAELASTCPAQGPPTGNVQTSEQEASPRWWVRWLGSQLLFRLAGSPTSGRGQRALRQLLLSAPGKMYEAYDSLDTKGALVATRHQLDPPIVRHALGAHCRRRPT
jgi:hypothetical protein